MKNVMRTLAVVIIGIVLSTIISAIDLATWLLAFIGKCVRVASLWILVRVGGIEGASDEIKAIINYNVNYANEYIFDELYPTE